VGPTPIVVEGVGAALRGQPVGDEAAQQAAELARAAARPISDVRGTERQRRHLAAVLTRRALAIAVARARLEDH
jgi:carbon-monoxide dehydrogenase medium subunit